MKTKSFFAALALALVVLFSVDASRAVEPLPLWPDLAPNATADDVKPTYEFYAPEKKSSDVCVIVVPGGAYEFLDAKEARAIASYFNAKGICAVVLLYRVPQPRGPQKRVAPWQDSQRLVRIVRSRAQEWGIDPNKIGMLGWSAGGRLTLLSATTSQTNSYEPIDEIDKLPCNVNFAVPIYPAYVLEDGADGPNANGGEGAAMLDDFAFDAATPPMFLLHGDADVYSPLASIETYKRLRKMGVPAEFHLYARIGHGFAATLSGDHYGNWLERVYAWMKTSKICD